jgi:hypothetical protein
MFEGIFSGTVGSGGSEGGQVKGLHLDWTGATLQGDSIDAYPVYVDARGITITGGCLTAFREFSLARFVDDTNDTLIGVSDGTGESAIRTNGEINDRDYFSFFEDFCMQTINETDFGIVLHSNGTGSDPAIAANRAGGQIDLVTGGTTDDGSELQVAIPVQAGYGKVVMEGTIKPSALTDVKIFIGLTDNIGTFEHPFSIDGSDVVTATADNACGFVYDTTAATDNWFIAAVNATTVDTGSSVLVGSAPSTTEFYRYRLELSSDGSTIKFYINGSLLGTLSVSGVLATADLYPTIVVSELNNSARTLVADYIYSGHTR